MTAPNILWICTDQQRWDTLGCLGNPWVRTPHLDALASEGALCTAAICQSPVCTPSRASFLTGRYPRTTRCRANGQAIPGDEILLPRVLREAGYLCGLSGKLHLAPCHPQACDGQEARIDDGYHVFDWSHHPAYGHGHDQPGNAYSAWLRASGRALAWKPLTECPHVIDGIDEPWHQTTWCVDRAIACIDAARAHGRSFFYSLNCFDPHHPFDPPAAYLDRYRARLGEIPLPVDCTGAPKTPWEAIDRQKAYGGIAMPGNLPDDHHRLVRAAYWAMCDLIDAQMGRLFAHLRRIGAWDDTIVIFSSDHGELLGDHGMYLKGPHFYEASVRVPLILRGPGIPRLRLDEPVELCDLAPTLCDLAGVAQPPGVQGRSLLPRLRGERAVHRDDAYCEFLNANFRFDPAPHGTMLRTATQKIVRFHGPAQRAGLLFDLVRDPDEAVDRWNDPAYAGVRGELLERLCDRIALTADPLPPQRAPW
jgi:arylsulfatase A-like enzyme